LDNRLPNLESLHAEKARRSFKEFIRQAWDKVEPDPFIPGWHIDAIADHLEACYYGKIDKLIINIPPRHSKSLLACVFYPAWVWIQNPKEQFVFASYGQNLAERDARKCRRLIQSRWFQRHFGDIVKITDGSNLIQRFENSAGGYRIATSVDGKLTGEGGSFIIIDDPHKADEAQSEVTRERVCDWYDQTVASRGNNPKAGRVVKILIMQRLHENDLTGHLLKKSGWTHLKLPLLYEPTEWVSPIGFQDPRVKEGEILCPERFGDREVQDFKEQGPYVFSGQYQQSPTPTEGGIFKKSWLRHYSPSHIGKAYYCGKDLIYPTDGLTFMTVDLAASKRESADYTVMATWAIVNGQLLLLDLIRERLEGPEILSRMSETCHKYQASFVAVESVGFQLALCQLAYQAGVPIREMKADHDKVSRAIAATPAFAAGNVWLPQHAHWLDEYVHELLMFPNGEHDDMVDATAYACQLYYEMRNYKVSRGHGIPQDDRDAPVKHSWDEYSGTQSRRVFDDWAVGGGA
jgi:predicted phage terminase large subunit-like protein